jgi:hypothetical protein
MSSFARLLSSRACLSVLITLLSFNILTELLFRLPRVQGHHQPEPSPPSRRCKVVHPRLGCLPRSPARAPLQRLPRPRIRRLRALQVSRRVQAGRGRVSGRPCPGPEPGRGRACCPKARPQRRCPQGRLLRSSRFALVRRGFTMLYRTRI